MKDLKIDKRDYPEKYFVKLEVVRHTILIKNRDLFSTTYFLNKFLIEYSLREKDLGTTKSLLKFYKILLNNELSVKSRSKFMEYYESLKALTAAQNNLLRVITKLVIPKLEGDEIHYSYLMPYLTGFKICVKRKDKTQVD